MASYWVKGADGKPYHAADEATVLQWIKENRIAAFTEIRRNDSDEFKKAETYAEFHQAFQSSTNVYPPEISPGVPAVQSQCSLQVGLALKEGWQIFRNNILLSYGALVAWIFIFAAIGFVPGFFQGFLTAVLGNSLTLSFSSQTLSFLFQMVLTGPFTVGFYKFWLNMVDQNNPRIRDFFDGFIIWWPAMLSQWLKLFITLGLFALLLPFFSLSIFSKIQDFVQTGQPPRLEEFGVLLLALACISVVIVIVMSFFWFVEFFLADRYSLKVTRCFAASFRLVLNHFSGFALLFTALTLILIGGLLAFIIGIFLVLPWTILAMTHAYRQLTPKNIKS